MTAGHDNLFLDSYPSIVSNRLGPVLAAAGVSKCTTAQQHTAHSTHHDNISPQYHYSSLVSILSLMSKSCSLSLYLSISLSLSMLCMLYEHNAGLIGGAEYCPGGQPVPPLRHVLPGHGGRGAGRLLLLGAEHELWTQSGGAAKLTTTTHYR